MLTTASYSILGFAIGHFEAKLHTICIYQPAAARTHPTHEYINKLSLRVARFFMSQTALRA